MKNLIQVCGDPTVDWSRIHNEDIIVRGGVYYWKKQKETAKVRLSSKPGGTAMVLQLLNEMIPEKAARVEGVILDEELLSRPKDSDITTSWTVWREFPTPGFNHQAFRIEKWHEFEPGKWDYASAKLTGYPDLLIIQDSNLGFRTANEGWPAVLSSDCPEKRPRDIILKLGQYNDSRENPLLDRIAELGLADSTTIFTTLSDLRSCTVKIGISLSWERMLEEVVTAVLSPNCPFVDVKEKKIKYKQVIVSIGASGTVIVGKDTSTLIFDRSGQEGDFASQFPGQMMGYNTCLIGALATTWAENPEQLDWIKATWIGVKLARMLHVQGYEVVESDRGKHLRFPNKAVAGTYRELKSGGKRADDPLYNQIGDLGCYNVENDTVINEVNRDSWTILEDNLLKTQKAGGYSRDPQSAINECARNIVVKGALEALPDVPVETIGAWSSAERQEIEGVRSVNNAMKDYLQLKNPETPLCVAVFGPPGSGKSFVVREIAKGLGIREEAQLTFNLSQFESPNELQNAFHQIRDLNLKGKTPLVFWDEFDTPCEGRPLGWLRYFLAPMQDGEFTDEGALHPLGGGIYVFAGATRHSFEEFRTGNNLADRNAKKPDFLSRLRAYINIRGINGNPNTVEDRLCMIRRAFMLRQYLETNAPQIKKDERFEIEAGVLDAFLRVTKYTHGARSMENLIKMSSLADKRKFELSSLPPDHIVGMHVNVKEFNALTCLGHLETLGIGIVGHTNLDPNQIEKLEQAVFAATTFIGEQFPEHYLTVFSTLAMGADRLVARKLLAGEASQLIAVLPVPRDEYINEFGSSDDYRIDRQGAALRQEFKYWLSERATEIIEMPPSPTRRAAYLKAGCFIAENSEILIVVWNGQDRQNASVTAQIVARAEKLNRPICHIRADDGEIRYENFPKRIAGGRL
ncbi:MAG: ATP-binding protein [Heliobacteriaceae bacterium]|nr:ATP-binding protein [Heliobacteriaceae bacterium]MDD4588579.1 ATP-binding protein [Heliobacteriaceae bacterium]